MIKQLFHSAPLARWTTWLLLACMAVVLVPPTTHAQQPSSAFQTDRCMFTLPAGMTEPRDVQCGYLRVPERHGEPEGPTIQLAVAIIKSHSATPAPDPLVMLQGGPGGSTIDTYAETLLDSQHILAIDRDIVLFDQRGTLYSKPALQCHETLDLLFRTINTQQTDAEEDQQSLAALDACRNRLAQSGVRLANYDSVENAADVDALRVALGYETINLYGVSYGTLLALHVLRDYGPHLRSVILDAVVPTQLNFLDQVPQSQQRAFNELFAACAADPQCNAAYPDLEQGFWNTVDRWNTTPVQIPLVDSESGNVYQARFDGDMLVNALFQMVYSTELLPALPKVIADAQTGDYAFLSRVLPIFLFDRTFSEGMYYSVICAEDVPSPQQVPLDGVRPELAKDAQRSDQLLQATCQQWNVPPLEPIVHAPVQSAVPTLVLNGRFDPITPPAFGQTAAQTLSNSYSFVFPNTGHGALLANPCATSIATSFIANPQRAPEAGCFATQTAPTFITPSNVLMAPSIQRMLAAVSFNDPTQYLPLLALLLGLLALLSTVVVWPVGLVVRLVRGRAADRRGMALLARAAAVLVAACGTGFVAGMVYILFSSDNIALFFGVPQQYAPLFILPLVVVLCAAAMLVLAVVAWRRGFWTVWGRLYYTVLLVGALGVAGTLLWWRVPGALFGV